MQFGYHLCGGGAELAKRYKLAATVANVGVPIIMTATTGNISPATTTSFADCVGLGIDTATYSTAQATLATAGTDASILVSVRPDLVARALMSGGAAESTALAVLTNTSASSGGTLVTAANTAANDMDGGTVWCIGGGNVNQSRTITTHSASTSVTVTVPFLRTIAVDDTFLMCPHNNTGTATAGNDGITSMQTTTLFTQDDATIASGGGAKITCVELYLNGTTNSEVLFIFSDHIFGVNTV